MCANMYGSSIFALLAQLLMCTAAAISKQLSKQWLLAIVGLMNERRSQLLS